METKPFYLKQLENVFEHRSKGNPRYSLRAFARDLGFSISRLSGVMNGKFGLSADAAQNICKTLGFRDDVAEIFVASVEEKHSRSKKGRELAAVRLRQKKETFKSLSLEQFQIVSDWQHFAILELASLKDFKAENSASVAKRLGISEIEARKSIERLVNFDLLLPNKSGFLKSTGSFFAHSAGNSNDAIKTHQKQLLEKARLAIDTQSVSEREIRSLTIGINTGDLPELQKLLNQFQTKLKKKANQSQLKDEVYAMTLQFFRLTQKESI